MFFNIQLLAACKSFYADLLTGLSACEKSRYDHIFIQLMLCGHQQPMASSQQPSDTLSS